MFDVNTPYKHAEVLGNNAFVYEDETVFLAWQNFYDPADRTVIEALDVFTENEDGSYSRQSEEIVERAYPLPELREMLLQAGFPAVNAYGDLTTEPPRETDERVWFVAVK